MFDKRILNSIKTAGVLLLYKDRFAFMVGPNQSCRKLGVVRLGGHKERNEGIISCIKREVMEEASVNITIVSAPTTYYKAYWDEKGCQKVEHLPLEIKPIIVVGNRGRSTALYLARTEQCPIPAAEAHGILLLSKQDIRRLCSEPITLAQFVEQGGTLLQREDLDFELELEAGPHLKFLRALMDMDQALLEDFMKE